MTTSDLLVEPAFLSVPPFERTLGPEVADLARLADFPPDPEQELALDALFAMDARDKSVAFEEAIICCRQNMKTGTFKQAALGWLFITDQRLIVWSAHEFATAQEAFRDMDQLVTGSDYLRRRVKNIYRGNGDESIELTTGQRLIFKTRTKGGGRGLSGDKVILDEAFALQPMHMGALLPTLSARPDPQVVYGSSAGLNTSSVLRAIRERGRPGGDPALAYLEWCAPEDGCETPNCEHALNAIGCALDDRENWQVANPALGRRITVEYIANERRAMPPAEFGRERLGWWDELLVDESDLDLSGWLGLEDPQSELESVSAFAIEVSVDRGWASVGAAGPSTTGRLHLEVVEHRAGTAWVVARCVELDKAHGPTDFVVDPHGPAGSLIPALQEAGLSVVETSTDDVASATAGMIDGIAQALFVHGPQFEVDAAISGARKRSMGDGRFAFGRTKSGGDVSPLVAITLAAWRASQQTAYAHVMFVDEPGPPADGINRSREGVRILSQAETTTIRYPGPS